MILTMAKVKAKYNLVGKPLSEAGLIRVACYQVADYWRKWFKRINGIDCSHCSQAQKRKCREEDLYRECPKAIKIESLDRVIEDGDGDGTGLHELIADDNAVDVVARLDARLTLQGYPHKFVYRLAAACRRIVFETGMIIWVSSYLSHRFIYRFPYRHLSGA